MYTHTPLVKKSRRKKVGMLVVLGSHTVKAFVASPKEFKVLGIVKMGMEFGLLAIDAQGEYVRVNGSLVQPLDRDEVEDCIAMARAFGRGESYATTRESQCFKEAPRGATLVAFRKHRKIDRTLIASNMHTI